MNCPPIQERMARLRPGDDDTAVSAHLTTCPACRAVARADARVWERLGALPSPEADLWSRVEARLPVRGPSWLDRLALPLARGRVYAVAAAVALALGLSGGAWLGGQAVSSRGPSDEPLTALFDVPSARSLGVPWLEGPP